MSENSIFEVRITNLTFAQASTVYSVLGKDLTGAEFVLYKDKKFVKTQKAWAPIQMKCPDFAGNQEHRTPAEQKLANLGVIKKSDKPAAEPISPLDNCFELKMGSYSCVEAAYQAMKLLDKDARTMFHNISGAEAKKRAKNIKVRDDWETLKDQVMLYWLEKKFQAETMKQELIKAENIPAYVNEDGVDVGKMLTDIRAKLLEEYKPEVPDAIPAGEDPLSDILLDDKNGQSVQKILDDYCAAGDPKPAKKTSPAPTQKPIVKQEKKVEPKVESEPEDPWTMYRNLRRG